MIRLIYKLRFVLLLAIAASVFVLLPYIKLAVEVDNSLSIWFLKDDPAVKKYHAFHQKFGNDEIVIAVIENPKSVLTPAYFRKFIAVTNELNKITEVHMVLGPGNSNLVNKSTFGVLSEPLITANSNPAQVKENLQASPFLKEQLFNTKYTSTRFLISFKSNPNFDKQRAALLRQVKTVFDKHFKAEQTYFGGVGVVYEGLNQLSKSDFGFFLSLGYLVMFLLILLIYRKITILLYAIITVSIATCITLGLYGFFGFQLNLMTILIPCILIVLGIIDIIHILNEYNQLPKGKSNKENALTALKNVWRPCLFTSLTTMAGFLSLLTSPMAILQQFGLFAALGIFLCLILTYIFGVIFLPLAAPAKTTIFNTQKMVNGFLTWVNKYRKKVSIVSLLTLLMCFAGIIFLKSDTYTLGYFPKNNKVVQDDQQIQRTWGAYMPVELIVIPAKGKNLYDPEIIKGAINFTTATNQMNGAGKAFGFYTFYQAALQAHYGNRANRLINSKGTLRIIHQQIPLYYPTLYPSFVHEASNTGRITLFGNMLSAKELNLKMDTLLKMGKKAFGNSATLEPSGYQPMYANIVKYVTESQVRSLFISALLIFVLVFIFIKDLRLTFLATLTNLIPVAVMMGIMGWFNITLDTASASIAAIVLSICIDDTIHFIYKYKGLKNQGLTPQEAQILTINHLGSSIFLSSTVLVLGYALMIFASLKTVSLFGLLTVIALIAALFVALVVLPLILTRFDR